MLTATTAIGTIMLVLSFLSTALGLSPLGSTDAGHIDEEAPFSGEAVKATADQFNTMYGSIVEDIASFAANPDLALAESRRDAMTAYAESLAGQLDDFASTMQQRLDEATGTTGS